MELVRRRWLKVATFLLPLLCSTVFTASPASAQVRAPTLRDEVRQKGFVRTSTHPEARSLATFDQLVGRSDLIICGRVVDERTRLSPDEYFVLTDYTIEVLEIFKDATHEAKVGDRLVVTKMGGNLVLEGKPVRMDTPEFPPIPWIAPHLFFVARWGGADAPAQYGFTGVAAGVFAIHRGTIACHDRHKLLRPSSIAPVCGSTEAAFASVLKQKVDATP